MSSTDRVDYSIRQNKSIERSIVFDGLREIYSALDPRRPPTYIGFGSVWFTDFHLAHRQLGASRLISMEVDDVTALRASFNRPYRTIEVVHGNSIDLLPTLLEREDLRSDPWVAWLDFDQAMDADRLQQLDDLIRYLPDNSTLITTFSATASQYGKPAQRVATVRSLFGFAAPDDLTSDEVRDQDDLARVLLTTVKNRLVSLSLDAGRPPAIPSFALCYRDGTPMVTVGLVLPDPESATTIGNLVGRDDWLGIVAQPISTPPLTVREVNALRSLLPSSEPISRDQIREIGFDLSEDQLGAFITHYKRYPTFAQLAW